MPSEYQVQSQADAWAGRVYEHLHCLLTWALLQLRLLLTLRMHKQTPVPVHALSLVVWRIHQKLRWEHGWDRPTRAPSQLRHHTLRLYQLLVVQSPGHVPLKPSANIRHTQWACHRPLQPRQHPIVPISRLNHGARATGVSLEDVKAHPGFE